MIMIDLQYQVNNPLYLGNEVDYPHQNVLHTLVINLPLLQERQSMLVESHAKGAGVP